MLLLECAVETAAFYRRNTPDRIKFIDALIALLLLSGAVQLVYGCTAGTCPLHSVYSGLASPFGTAALTLCLRTQVVCPDVFGLSPERAFADWLVCVLVLHVVCIAYSG
eukprot:gnl/TRDRNA2_/TRDRNA2_191830_c0_seq1.p2 gnl/TRDRNA2_/TRDRNA2_191830_c0~~gnl/TRDRNA2_/TRDRNA2_191830_c0_seq1.p2  ORF type:complete len:109 (-),score=10.63 gnl/TRDRNA2_/TRDRNA2_191830_c0_seq1:121-447(-)